MGTVRLGTFPSLNNKGFQDDIAKSLLTWFIHRFPVGFFNHIYLDTQNSVASSYQMNNATGELQKLESGAKILQPAIRMNVKQGLNNHKDIFGSLWNVNQQPGAHQIDTDLTGYKPFLYDPYGIILATNEYTIRNNFEIIVDLQTKADQLAFLNICNNNLKSLYVQTTECEAGIILPTLLTEYIRKTVFKPELEVLDKMVADSEEKIEYRQKINDKFNQYLYEFSGKSIKPFREHATKTGVSNYLHKLMRKQLLTMRFEEPDPDEGTKKGAAYTGFQVTISGWIEYGNPISFMTSVPAIVRGAKNDHFIRTSSKTTSSNQYHIMEFKEVFKDNRHLLDVDSNIWRHFYFEREIMMASNTEDFNILDDVIVEEDTPSHYYIMKALLYEIQDLKSFNELFKVVIYKNNEILDPHNYSIDKNFNFHIKNCDLSIPYYIDIFVNKNLYIFYMNIIVDKLKSIGIIINDQEVNSHFRRNYNAQITSSDYEYNKPYYHPDRMNVRAYWYNTATYNSTSQDGIKTTFIPIKTHDFLKADDKYDYFTKSVDDKFIPITDEVVEKRPDLDFYIQDNSGSYIHIDRKNVMIPDNSYEYFLFDRNTSSYIKQKNLIKFDENEQYYIPIDKPHNIKIDI